MTDRLDTPAPAAAATTGDGDPRPPEPEAPVPGVRLLESLGRGAHGMVRRGRHETLEVDVAVKLVAGAANDAAALARALGEARLMARLDHPNLLRIHDAGRTGGSVYLVLELMDGGSLAGRHRVPPEEMLHLARQLLSGLQALHEARIIHRDIKPANCLLRRRDARVKLADLGIATELATSTRALDRAHGTLPFMAPELLDSPPRFGPSTDIYALGMTLAALALPEDPFPRGSVGALLQWIRAGERPRLATVRPDLDPALAALIDRMIAIDPDDRPAGTAAALAWLCEGAPARRRRPARATAPDPETGETVGPWVLGAELYTGNNWHTRAATHARTGAPAQLSHVLAVSRLAGGQELVLQSAERASELDHPGVLAMLDWGRWKKRAYVVTAPRGRSLKDLVASTGPLGEVDALELCAAIADALVYLHGRGLVYQIVDAANALITADARSAQLGWPIFCVPAGAPARDESGRVQRVIVAPAGAPEAFFAEGTIEPSVDVYGLGAILYFLLTGRRTYAEARSVDECLVAKRAAPTDLRERASEVTRPTDRLVRRMLEPDAERRPAAAGEVADELRRIARRLRG